MLTSLVSGNAGIFAAFSMSFPFVLPIMLAQKNTDRKKLILSGFIYAIPGILIALAFSKLYGGMTLVFPAAVSLFSLVCLIAFSVFKDHLSAQKVTFLKAAVIFLIFILCLTA